VREGVEQVEAARAQYERVRLEAEEELRKARSQAHLIMVQAGAARDSLLEEARTEAKQEASLLLENGRAQLAEERRAMVEQLRREFNDAAISAAEAIIAETLDAKKHRELIARALDERLPLPERENPH